jgi:hypothetical protein
MSTDRCSFTDPFGSLKYKHDKDLQKMPVIFDIHSPFDPSNIAERPGKLGGRRMIAILAEIMRGKITLGKLAGPSTTDHISNVPAIRPKLGDAYSHPVSHVRDSPSTF